MDEKDLEQQQKLQQAMQPVVTSETVREAAGRMEKYRQAKLSVDERIVADEQFWKMKQYDKTAQGEKMRPTAWLWNVVMSKLADMIDGFPEANVRPKERADVPEAETLSAIVPVILEENNFKRTYTHASRVKLGSGTAVYSVLWDKSAHNGWGDVKIGTADVLNLFWEPGITNIQDSRELFFAQAVDNEQLMGRYPELRDKLGKGGGGALTLKEYIHDDQVDLTTKSLVIDWYYKQQRGGKTVLQFCKFVGDVVLYATENEQERPQRAVRGPDGLPLRYEGTGELVTEDAGPSVADEGIYTDGKFPFVFDVLYEQSDSPCGYGFFDICRGTQEDIDSLNHAIIKNALLSAKPRYFARDDGSVDPTQFADYNNDLVMCKGNLGEDSIRAIEKPELPASAVSMLEQKIEELKETSGNRDVNNGGSTAGVTAASAIASLQEQSAKGMRSVLAGTYEAFKEIVYMVIERIRQFYDVTREFRITGQNGHDDFVAYNNAGLQPQPQEAIGSVQPGPRVPQFDIEVSAQKATPYSKMSQNELALQFYNAGLFAPGNADQALSALQMMDFQHKEDVIDVVTQNGTLMQKAQQLLQISMAMAARFDPMTAQRLAGDFADLGGQELYGSMRQMMRAEDSELPETNPDGTLKPEEHPFVRQARERVAEQNDVTA